MTSALSLKYCKPFQNLKIRKPSSKSYKVNQFILVLLNYPYRFHFDALAHDNSAEKAEIEQIGGIPNARRDATPSAIVLQGTQLIKKSDPDAADTVKILMALYRVQEKNVDLLATFNIPLVQASGVMSEAEFLKTTHDFREFATSLKIIDFGLFA